MIINKTLSNLGGNVEYEIFFGFECECEDGGLLEYEKFTNLTELLEAVSPDKVEEIRSHYDAVEVKITGISFNTATEDREAGVSVMIGEKVQGWVTAKFDNKDVESCLLANLEKVKRIIDNTLNEYPVQY
ncbi:hypothetical protein SAMN04489735_104529 [Aneurinibacillus thermoaerophilus]|uniref:Uncharacterized protein n=1 Tax=Aneurinibacillus thermoaerophilus TaxID=143495 RepID=A0A1G8EL96_ANETH|nr:hypothetical protein [Aneurinibacillus thermoaerophilus]QYY44751.1 hypothetical protein K3F53_19095 [Aneurinibacillus thermoaerophilus]SDH70668.1 hypothetical protein SAMN04489735_104529 [Aneurinibacillus thermoaerophilus]